MVQKPERTFWPPDTWVFQVALGVRNPPATAGDARDAGSVLHGVDMETHSSTLAWKIPGAEEPGGLQSMESQRVRDS